MWFERWIVAANVGRMIDAVTGCLAAFAGRYGRDVIKRMDRGRRGQER